MLRAVLNNIVGLINSPLVLNGNLELSSISMINDGDEFLESSKPILLSVVNIEEDRTMKNNSIYNYESLNLANKNARKVVSEYNHPTQHLIISLLFASYQKTNNMLNYLDGLENLEKVMAFLQANNAFYQHKTTTSQLLTASAYKIASAAPSFNENEYFKVTTEFVSLSNEQQNSMWSYLGSKYMPSALYKLRLILIQEPQAKTPVADIKQVKVQHRKDQGNDPSGILEEGTFEKKIIAGKEVIQRVP
jgi:hypothetical protein